MKILHLIDSLNYGGAETLLMSYIPLLTHDEHFVVTLSGPNVYDKANYEYINLNAKPVKGILKAVLATRKIVAEKHIDIIHSHSFWTNIISRLAAGGKIKLINHYHFADYDTMKHKPAVKKMILLDRITTRKTLIRVAVSEYLAKILRVTFPKGNIKVIPNFITCNGSMAKKESVFGKELRVIAVGNCNIEKNYELVLQAFEDLKEEPICIDIIGNGDRLDFYRNEASRRGLHKLRFCGGVANAKDHLKNYDLYLSASFSETFGISVLESVCAKLPMLISDIPPFNEIAPHGSLFFNPYDKNDLVNKLRNILKDRRNPDTSDYDRVIQKYSSQTYLSALTDLYNL